MTTAITVRGARVASSPIARHVVASGRVLRGGCGRWSRTARHAGTIVNVASQYADLERWTKRAEHAVGIRENPLYLDLDDLDDHDDFAELANELRASRTRREPSNAADPDSGLFMTEHGALAVIFVRPAADSLDLGASAGLLHEIEGIVAATHPERAGARIAGYTGSIPSALSEVQAVRHDIASTSILVLVCVGGVVIWYFRGIRELFLLGAPLVVGIAVALGFAELAIGHLNAQTAFLGSVMVGTGINYGVILLDRFRQHRWQGDHTDVAIVAACAGTLQATSVAAAATAFAFGTLAAGEVESFRQFGWIGGFGIPARRSTPRSGGSTARSRCGDIAAIASASRASRGAQSRAAVRRRAMPAVDHRSTRSRSRRCRCLRPASRA